MLGKEVERGLKAWVGLSFHEISLDLHSIIPHALKVNAERRLAFSKQEYLCYSSPGVKFLLVDAVSVLRFLQPNVICTY